MRIRVIGLCLCVILILGDSAWSRMSSEYKPKDFGGGKAALALEHNMAGHRIGAMELAVNNNGTIGTGFKIAPYDAFTGEPVASCEYPRGSNVQYLFAGAFWIGAVVGRDTLVSVGADGWSSQRELYPDESPFGGMIKRSITNPNSPLFENAISEEDYISVYTDTFRELVDPDYFGRAHMPLNIEITDASYAWSYAYADDFVLFDYKIKNIGVRDIEEVYMGLYVDADVCNDCDNTAGYADDLCGFLHTYPTEFGNCVFNDTVNIAWIADNDGDFSAPISAKHVTATRIVRTPGEEMKVSFNWWVSNSNASLDFGPRHRNAENFRDLRTGGLGTPEGDVNKYNFLQNREFDYDQAFVASISITDTTWLYPSLRKEAKDISDGYDTRYLLSFGPFSIRPGQTLPVSLAYVGGMDLHTDAGNFANLPDEPAIYYAGLDFSHLANNATWAGWIYDNPGVDTDEDGFRGLYHICCADSAIVQDLDTFLDTLDNIDSIVAGWACIDADTFYYQGDGVPDFRGASPPPAPEFWLDPAQGQIKVRFNGLRSETTKDVFSRAVDFEGYRVYVGRDDRASSYGLVASYDVEDYNKLVFVPGEDGYVLYDVPFTVDSLRCLYAPDSCEDTGFDPEAYTRSSPFSHPDYPESTFIFEAQDYNASEFGPGSPIRKLHPFQDEPKSLIPDSAQPGELTDDGYFKYYEYEAIIEGLLPTVPYYVNVTAFDYGSPKTGLASLETSVTVNAQSAYPTATTDQVARENLKVYVYPNPYRLDGEYLARGFEGRIVSLAGDNPPENRTRLLNFANLPPKCTIRIYTIDGDLVREIEHDEDPSTDSKASHETWNLITRNTQMIVSGLYYWTVESPNGEVQIGKLAVIM